MATVFGCLQFHFPFSIPQATTQKPKSSCVQGCSKVIKQVCGSDNVTYDNKCLLEKTACEKDKVITVVKNGKCEGMLLFLNLHFIIKEWNTTNSLAQVVLRWPWGVSANMFSQKIRCYSEKHKPTTSRALAFGLGDPRDRQVCWYCGVMVRALKSGSSPGQSRCVLFLGKTLNSHSASLRLSPPRCTGKMVG